MSSNNNYKNYKVSSIYLKNICIGSGEFNLKKILSIWQKTKKRVYVIVNEQGNADGIITLYDIIKEIIPYFLKIDKSFNFFSSNELIDEEKFQKLKNKKAKDIMTKNPITVEVNDDVMKVITLMYSYNFDYLPVVDKNRKVVGIVDKEVIENYLVNLVHQVNKSD